MLNHAKLTPERLSRFRSYFQFPVVFCLKLLVGYKFKGFQVSGLENLPKRQGLTDQSVIVVSNHTTAWDPPILSIAMRYQPISYMAKEELFEKWLSRTFYTLMGTFSVNRTKLEVSTIKSAKMVLETRGLWYLGMFPQGTRSDSLEEVKDGVGFIAKLTQAPVLPVGIAIVDKNIQVCIGQLIPPSKDVAEMSKKVQEALIDLKGRAEAEILGLPASRSLVHNHS
jgi:1-acyl-sn-glycerol-3-phosphate acyltransferase